MNTASAYGSPLDQDGTGTISAGNTLFFFDFKVFPPTQPEQGLLQQTYRQVATGRLGMPFPA